MKEKNDLLYIKDSQNQKLFYQFTPAAIASQFVPLIVILDTQDVHFEYKMWNVLTPIGDVYDKNLLQKLISEIVDENECEEHLYFYGGAQAVLHGVLSKAHAVYTKEFVDNNLDSLFNSKDAFPIFYLCDKKSQGISFVEACEKYDICLHLDKCIKVEDDESSLIKKVLDMCEKMNPKG